MKFKVQFTFLVSSLILAQETTVTEQVVQEVKEEKLERVIPDEEQDKWSFVTVHRRNRKGELHYKGPSDKPWKYHYLLNRESGNLYHEITEEAMSLKCLQIAAGAPFYTVGNMILQHFKVCFDLGSFSLNTYYEIRELLSENKSYREAFQTALLKNGLDLSSRLGKDLYEFIASVGCGPAMLGCAVKGVIYDPYEAAEQIGAIERFWHCGKGAKEADIARHYPEIWKEGSDWTLYLAYCIQKVGNVDDLCENGEPKWEVLEYKKEKSTLTYIENLPCKALPLKKN